MALEQTKEETKVVMPQIYRCGNCGFILDELQIKYTLDKPLSGTCCTKIYQPLKTPGEVIEKCSGRCPNCGKHLEFKRGNVKVTLPQE